ncbi:uncharacterized protein LOC135847995 [Planococcus citri]|uniref:uncharacterized protein LOC135847995 n=1 Tax=Planococcus citri TaxID=170843 RepID=UPI0031F8D902
MYSLPRRMRRFQVIILLVLLVAINLKQTESGPSIFAIWPFDRTQPINIRSDRAFPIPKPNATVIRNGDGTGENALLINTGESVEVRLLDKKTDLSITGPAIANYLYVYTRTIFYWAKDATGSAGTLIDGKHSAPLEVLQLYYNTKYTSYTKSLEHGDGVVIVIYRFTADAEEDNPEIEPFLEKLKEVRTPGSTMVEMEEDNMWYLKISNKGYSYFIYSGSVTNVTEKETYDCAITIVIRDMFSLSKNQFEAFTNIEKDDKGTKLITEQKTYNETDHIVGKTDEKVFIPGLEKNATKFPSFP